MAARGWLRWLWPLSWPRRTRPSPVDDTLARRVDSAVRGSKERALLRSAEESLRRGRRADALRAYRAALEVFEDRGAHLKCAAVLATLTRIEPDDPENFEALARVQEKLGRRPESEASRRQAALLREARGESTLARKLRAEPPASDPEGGLRVHDRPRAEVVRAPVSEMPPPSVTNAHALDLGPLDPLPDQVPEEAPHDATSLDLPPPSDSSPTVHLEAVAPSPPPPPEQTAPNPIVDREPPLPPFEPLEPGPLPSNTDAAKPMDLDPMEVEPDESATMALPALTGEQLRAAEENAAPSEALADPTLWEPGFRAVDVPDAPTPHRPRGLAFPPKPRPAPSPTLAPTPRGRPQGPEIPAASTTLDPDGSAAAADARRRRRNRSKNRG